MRDLGNPQKNTTEMGGISSHKPKENTQGSDRETFRSEERRVVFLWIAQISHPHSSKLQGISQNIRCLEKLLTVLSAQKLLTAPIAAEAW